MSSQEWMEKGDRDLRLAKLALEDGIHDYALFHAQQAVEKYLKAYLVSKDKPFRKRPRHLLSTQLMQKALMNY